MHDTGIVIKLCYPISSQKQDEFYQDVTLQLSDFLFIVLDQITRTGVEIVKRASDALASSKSTKTLVVIHNLRNVSSAQEAVNIWNVRNILLQSMHYSFTTALQTKNHNFFACACLSSC